LTQTRYRYRAFGLDIGSNIQLPELPPATLRATELHLVIEVVAGSSEQPHGSCHELSLCNDGVLLRVSNVGEFFISQGQLIRLTLAPDADVRLAKVYLLGSAMGLALYQRNLLVMHASAVLIGGRATLFVGSSGAGKSTLAASLSQHGYSVLADDLVPIAYDAQMGAVVWPGACSFKLRGDSVDSLRLRRGDLAPISNRVDKFYVPNPNPAVDRSYVVERIMVLGRVPNSELAGVDKLGMLPALRAITTHAYRPNYIELLGIRHQHFYRCAQLAEHVPVFLLRRTWDLAQVTTVLQSWL